MCFLCRNVPQVNNGVHSSQNGVNNVKEVVDAATARIKVVEAALEAANTSLKARDSDLKRLKVFLKELQEEHEAQIDEIRNTTTIEKLVVNDLQKVAPSELERDLKSLQDAMNQMEKEKEQ